MYLMLKELANIADDVIIVIASLTKDMNSKIDLYHANAVRVLCKIADVCILLTFHNSPLIHYVPTSSFFCFCTVFMPFEIVMMCGCIED